MNRIKSLLSTHDARRFAYWSVILLLVATVAIVLVSCAEAAPERPTTEQPAAERVEYLPEVGFSTAFTASATIPDNWTSARALHQFMSPVITGFVPNTVGIAAGGSFSVPFFDTSITFSVTVNQGIFRYLGVIANGSGTIEVLFNAAAKTFELRERYMVIDPLREGGEPQLTALTSPYEQIIVFSKTTPDPIPLNVSTLGYQGMVDTRVLVRVVKPAHEGDYGIQAQRSEVFRNGNVTAVAMFSGHGSSASDIPEALRGSGFSAANLEQLSNYLDGKSLSGYGAWPTMVEFDGAAYRVFRSQGSTTIEGEQDFPPVYKTESAAPNLAQFKQFLSDRHSWNSALVELQ